MISGMADQFVICSGVLGAGLNDPELRLRPRGCLASSGLGGQAMGSTEDLLTSCCSWSSITPMRDHAGVVVGITNLLIIAGIDTGCG